MIDKQYFDALNRYQITDTTGHARTSEVRDRLIGHCVE